MSLKEFSSAVSTPKRNMLTPEICNEQGQVLCHEGHVAQLIDFDMDTLYAIYGGSHENIAHPALET